MLDVNGSWPESHQHICVYLRVWQRLPRKACEILILLSISTGFLSSHAVSSEGGFRETFTVLFPRLDPSALQNVQTDAAVQFCVGCSSSPITLLPPSLLELSVTVSLKPNVRSLIYDFAIASLRAFKIIIFVCVHKEKKTIMALWRYLQKESNQESWYLHGDRVPRTVITKVHGLTPTSFSERGSGTCVHSSLIAFLHCLCQGINKGLKGRMIRMCLDRLSGETRFGTSARYVKCTNVNCT